MAAIVACLGAVISPTPRVPSAAQRARIHPAPASRPTLPLRINGTWYDASAYALKHEGGRWLLEYARGRDVTALFRATHLFGETRAASHLATLRLFQELCRFLDLSHCGFRPGLLRRA